MKNMTGDKETIFVAFCNQKGGAGKSTSSMNIATAIWYDLYLKLDVSLWDCDNPHYSTSVLRLNDEIDIAQVMQLVESGKMKSLKKALDDLNQVLIERKTEECYPIKAIYSPEEGVEITKGRRIDEFSEKKQGVTIKEAMNDTLGNYDVVLLDLPGKLDSNETIELIPYIDYLMIPMDYDSKSMDSTMATIRFITEFASTLDQPPPFLRNNKIFLYFSKYKKGITIAKKEFAENEIIKAFPLVKAYKSYISEAENIKEDVLKTILPLPGTSANNEHFTNFYNEFITMII